MSHPEDLPVTAYKSAFFKLLRESDSVVVVGETGSGKTTQIPQWCLDYCKKRHHNEHVACTQPRRIAAMSVAERVATERKDSIGRTVGYMVRFERKISKLTQLKYLTDGMLLREATFFPDLPDYGVIILDEAHERTLQTEILFGVVKRAMKLRNLRQTGGDVKEVRPLKVVIMSASINIDLFRKYFDAPVLRIEGRQYPIQNYVSEIPQSDLLTSTLTCVFQVHRNCEPGDILVFCSGQDEIQSLLKLTRNALKYARAQPHIDESAYNLVAMPLYASLPAAQQMQVFHRDLQIYQKITNLMMTNGKTKLKSRGVNNDINQNYNADSDSDDTGESYDTRMLPKNFRRVIYATNVAETSVTIPEIKYVIDTGKVKCRQFCPRTGLESLKITNISKAQAKQRSGRAGRIGPGICYRLYTSEDYDQMAEYPVPEIKRCSLDSILLQLISIDEESIQTFEFLERPDDERIKSALRNLLNLKAIAPFNKSKSNTENNQNETREFKSNGTSQAISQKSTNKPSSPQSSHASTQLSIGTMTDDKSLLNLSYVLTQLGAKLKMFPLDPSMARVILAAHELGCLDEALTVISLLSVESLFHIPPSKQGQADSVLSKFHSNEGDIIMLLNVYRAFMRTSTINRKGLKQWCLDHFIHIRNLKTARLIRKQLSEISNSLLHGQSTCKQDTSLLRRALTYGLTNNVATMWDGKYRNKTSTKEIFIHPSSCLFKTRPECVLYIEVVETNKCYMRHCTLIDPVWVREANSVITS